ARARRGDRTASSGARWPSLHGARRRRCARSAAAQRRRQRARGARARDLAGDALSQAPGVEANAGVILRRKDAEGPVTSARIACGIRVLRRLRGFQETPSVYAGFYHRDPSPPVTGEKVAKPDETTPAAALRRG